MIEGATNMSKSFSVGQMGPYYGFEENAVSWDSCEVEQRRLVINLKRRFIFLGGGDTNFCIGILQKRVTM